MDVIKVKHFKILNQSNLDANCVTCKKCNNWLTTPIYLHSDDQNYCNTCLSSTETLRRNHALEQVLKDYVFPCQYKKCEHVSDVSEVKNHAQICIHAPSNNCQICEEKNMSLSDLENHLKEIHANILIKLDKPVLKLKLDNLVKTRMYIATLHNHVFVIIVKKIESKLTVNVAKLQNTFDKDVSTKFTVQCGSDDYETNVQNRFVSYSELCNAKHKVDICVEDDSELNIKILLCGFDKVPKLPVCPICEYNLGFTVHQCENGHNVCIDCGKKINTCAICRSQNISILKLRDLFPNASMLCKNFEDGCLFIGNEDSRDLHMKNCSFVKVECVECNINYPKCKILSHMEEMHSDKIWSNHTGFEFVKSTFVYQFFLSLENNIFCLSVKSEGSGATKKATFTATLLYSTNAAEAELYRFNVLIEDNHHKPVHLLKGACQIEGDEWASCWIYYDTCAKLASVIDDVEKIYWRISLFKSNNQM